MFSPEGNKSGLFEKAKMNICPFHLPCERCQHLITVIAKKLYFKIGFIQPQLIVLCLCQQISQVLLEKDQVLSQLSFQ